MNFREFPANQRITRFAVGPFVYLLLSVLLAALSGCRSDPHTDVYVDHMAAEIRVLEDQLYEADHENKILRDKLSRSGIDTSTGSKSTVSPKTTPTFPSRPPATTPTPAATTPQKTSPISPPPAKASPSIRDIPPEAPPARLGVPPTTNDIIPGETKPPIIDLGTRVAPPTTAEAPSNAADKVRLPAPVRKLLDEPTGPPEEIQLDPAQTRPFTENGRSGLDVVFLAFDRDHNITSIDSELEIAVVDPTVQGTEGRLAKWFVSGEQVRQATSPDRITSLRLFWPAATPANQAVKIYLRLRKGDEKGPSTDALLTLNGDPTSPDWLPRTARGETQTRK